MGRLSRIENRVEARAVFLAGLHDVTDPYDVRLPWSGGLTEAELQLMQSKALRADSDPAGGYLLAGRMLDELIRAEAVAAPMRRLARVLPPFSGESLAIPSQESLMSDGEWTTELGTGTEDSTTPFGRRVLSPWPITKRIRVSKKLLRQTPNAEQYVTESLAEAVGVPEDRSFINGDGAGEPLGVLNAAGVSVYTTAAAGAVTAADVKKWLWGLAGRYHANATILTHVDFLAMVAQLDDASLKVEKGSLAGFPVEVSDQFPSGGTATTGIASGSKLAVIGDFSFYWIADHDQAELQRLDQLYAVTNETGFQLRREVDGMPVIDKAFRVLKVQ